MFRLEAVLLLKAKNANSDLENKIRNTRYLKRKKLEDIFEDQEVKENPFYSAGQYYYVLWVV